MRQAFFLTAGWLSVVLAIAGAFLPLLPCTPFALLAAACFARSSPRAMRWLRRSPLLGSALRDWERHRGLRPRVKFTAFAVVLCTPLAAFLLMPGFSWSLGCSLLGSTVGLIVVSRLPTIRPRVATARRATPPVAEKKLPLAA